MSEAVLYLPGLTKFSHEQKKDLKEAIKIDKANITEAMKAKVNDFKMQLLVEALEQKGLKYDNSINTFFDLRKSIMNSKEYSKEDKQELLDACVYIDENVNGLLSDLIDGATSSVEKFLKGMYQKIGKPLAKGTINGLAVSSLIQMAPTVETKLAVVAASLGVSAYKLIRGLKDRAYAKSIKACNEALRELETTKKDGKIVDTRYPENVIEKIKEYFKINNIPFEDTGYLSLRETLYNVDYDHKVELVRIIENVMGKNTGIDNKLDKYNENFTTFVNNNVFKPISAGASLALPIATVINQVDPALLSGPFNAFVAKLFSTGKMSEFLSWTVSASSGIGSFLLEHVPSVGKMFKALFAGENIVLISILGGAVGLAFNIGKGIVKAVSNKIQDYKSKKEEKEFREVELEKYKDNIKEELNKIESIINENGKDFPKAFIISLVCDYLEKRNIVLEEKPKNIHELEKLVDSLDNDTKKELKSILKEVLEYSEKYPKTFKEKVKEITQTTITLLSLGLASLNVYDMLTGKGILKKISDSDLLKGIPGTRLKEIPTIEGTEALRQKVDSEVPVDEIQPVDENLPVPDTSMYVNGGQQGFPETPHACEPPLLSTPGPNSAPAATPTRPPEGSVPDTSMFVNDAPPITTPKPVEPPLPVDSYGGHHPGTLTTYLATENPNPQKFFDMFHRDYSGGKYITFDELGREDAKRFLDYFQNMEVTAENKKDFDILSTALIKRIDKINSAIIAENSKIANLSGVYNSAIAGAVLSESYKGIAQNNSENEMNDKYTNFVKVR